MRASSETECRRSNAMLNAGTREGGSSLYWLEANSGVLALRFRVGGGRARAGTPRSRGGQVCSRDTVEGSIPAHLLFHLSDRILHHASRSRIVFRWKLCHSSDTKTLLQLFGNCITKRSHCRCMSGHAINSGFKAVQRFDCLLDSCLVLHALALCRHATGHHARLDIHHQERSSFFGFTSQGFPSICEESEVHGRHWNRIFAVLVVFVGIRPPSATNTRTTLVTSWDVSQNVVQRARFPSLLAVSC